MTEGYQFNENLRRFEPSNTNTLCKYCNKRHTSNMEDNYFIPVYKEQDRTTLIVYNSVKFNKVLVGIPRCKNCVEIHDKSTSKAWTITIVVLLFASLLMSLIRPTFYLSIIVFIFLFPVILVCGPYFLPAVLAKKQGILSKKDGAMNEIFILLMLQSGWSLKQPAA